MGEIGILNVGAGDTKLVFDRNNPAECIRSARIVTDMLRRGYALLVEEPPGSGTYTRVREFREATCEYIIADFDPMIAAAEDAKANERDSNAIVEPTAAASVGTGHAEACPADGDGGSPGPTAISSGGGAKRGRKPGSSRAVDASGRSGIAVARSAGG